MLACHPNSPSSVGKPNIILGFLVVNVENVGVFVVDVMLLFSRFLDFPDAEANCVRENKRKRKRDRCIGRK